MTFPDAGTVLCPHCRADITKDVIEQAKDQIEGPSDIYKTTDICAVCDGMIYLSVDFSVEVSVRTKPTTFETEQAEREQRRAGAKRT